MGRWPFAPYKSTRYKCRMATPTRLAGVQVPELEALATGCNALGHPLRLALLHTMAAGDELSPVQLAGLIDPEARPLTAVAYHVRRLEKVGLIALSRTAPVRGALEHHYRITPRGRAWLDALQTLPRG